MLARMRPASKIGQLAVGPIDQKRLEASSKLMVLLLERPNDPVSENLGNKSAVATPMRAVAAASCRSAARMSGRRRNRSEGSPTGTSVGTPGMTAAAETPFIPGLVATAGFS